jgi:hypothetical protein
MVLESPNPREALWSRLTVGESADSVLAIEGEGAPAR